MMWDSHGNLDPKGRLATDRPHVLKLYGAYIVPVRHADRRELLRRQRHAADDLRQHPQRHRGLRRGPWRHGPDADADDDRPVALARSSAWAGTQRLRFELNVLNVFNQKTVTAPVQLSEPRPARPPRSISHSTNLAQGYDYRRDDPCDARRGQRVRSALSTWTTCSAQGTSGHFLVKWLF